MYLFVCLYGVGRMDLDGGIHNEGRLKGWALKSRLFWALKWERAEGVPFGPKKVEISGPTPSKP
jgi:hypothetical protein